MRLALPEWVHNPTWLDDDNAITYVVDRFEGTTDPYMALWYHRSPKSGEVCFGSFGWRNPRPGQFRNDPIWERVSVDPLTVSPSLLCLDCGAHGWIKEGKWVPA